MTTVLPSVTAFFHSHGSYSRKAPSCLAMVMEKVSRATKSILDVWNQVRPHFVAMAPWTLSRFTQFRMLSVGAPLLLLWSGTETGDKLALLVYSSIAWDNMGLVSQNATCRIAVDAFLLLATTFGSFCALKRGVSILCSQKGKRLTLLVTGLLLASAGSWNFHSSCNSLQHLVEGSRMLQTFDPMQRESVVRARALHMLPVAKSCNAAIFDSRAFDLQHSVGEFIYQTCATRTYQVDSPDAFCTALKDARKHLGLLHLVSFHGHANYQDIDLGPNYAFNASSEEVACIGPQLAPKAQLFVLGCHTAFSNSSIVPLAEKLAMALPGHEITGVDTTFDPHYASISYVQGRFYLESFRTDSFPYISFYDHAVAYLK